MSDDLELKDLCSFIGTTEYHRGWLNTNYTDGVVYISNNGYSWLVTDAISVIKAELTHKDDIVKGYDFLVIKLQLLGDNKAKMVITDGNDKILYEQNYDYTDAKRELTLYYQNNVIMLSGEY